MSDALNTVTDMVTTFCKHKHNKEKLQNRLDQLNRKIEHARDVWHKKDDIAEEKYTALKQFADAQRDAIIVPAAKKRDAVLKPAFKTFKEKAFRDGNVRFFHGDYSILVPEQHVKTLVHIDYPSPWGEHGKKYKAINEKAYTAYNKIEAPALARYNKRCEKIEDIKRATCQKNCDRFFATERKFKYEITVISQMLDLVDTITKQTSDLHYRFDPDD